jgi:hypothetical protein
LAIRKLKKAQATSDLQSTDYENEKRCSLPVDRLMHILPPSKKRKIIDIESSSDDGSQIPVPPLMTEDVIRGSFVK